MPICRILSLEAASTPEFVAEWRRLSETAQVANPFFEPGFCLPAASALLPGRVRIAALVNGEGSLLALAPFTVGRFMHIGPKIAKFWTHGYIPLGTPLVTRDEEHAFEALVAGIADAERAPLFAADMKRLSELGPFSDLLEKDTVSSHERAALRCALPGVAYRAHTLSKRRRQSLERRFRRLAETVAGAGALEIELCRDPALLPERFEAFMALEKTGWKGSAGSALLSDPAHADFARAAAAEFSRRGKFTVASLKAGKAVLAALALFEANGEVFTWKIAFDEAYSAYSPGVQLLARFADPLMAEGRLFVLDSCAAPGNEIANAIWSERERIEDIVFYRPGHRAAAKAVRRGLLLEAGAKRALRRLRSR